MRVGDRIGRESSNAGATGDDVGGERERDRHPRRQRVGRGPFGQAANRHVRACFDRCDRIGIDTLSGLRLDNLLQGVKQPVGVAHAGEAFEIVAGDFPAVADRIGKLNRVERIRQELSVNRRRSIVLCG